jgi:hypothetical protein
MGRRKGELSQKMINRGWPFQVAVVAETCRGEGYVTTHYFCEGLSLCPRHGYFRRADRDYVVFCFADAGHAEQFRARFGGEIVTKLDDDARPTFL